MPRISPRAYIPKDVRRDLWISAGGRCEFRGCNMPVSRDFLTKERAAVGEYAHIIADSPDGARGVAGDSERLAKDPRNLMLACLGCHDRIDRHGQNNRYSVEDLRAMKRDHEARIELIYSADGVKDSLPILMSFPIGPHAPVVDPEDVRFAMLKNTGHTRFPVPDLVQINRADFDLADNMSDYWPRAESALTQLFERRVRPALTERNGVSHLTIAAFAPIPLLMKLGALVGDKVEALVLDLPGNKWLWEDNYEGPAPQYSYSVPENNPREVAVLVSISNKVIPPPSGSIPVIEFRADAPGRGIIRRSEHLADFRRCFDAFLLELARRGVRVIRLYPATSLSSSVEIGRVLLPKVFEEVHVWDWQAPEWKYALRLK